MGAFTIFDSNTGERILPLLTHAGAPTDGASGTFANVARKGWLLIDETNGAIYQNTGAQESPTWTLIEATNTFATLTSTGLATMGSAKLDTGTKTATATSGAATLHKNSGVITTESLTTAAGSEYALTLTNNTIAAGDIVLASVQNGDNTIAPIFVSTVTPASGSVVIKVVNGHASSQLNGKLKIAFAVLKA